MLFYFWTHSQWWWWWWGSKKSLILFSILFDFCSFFSGDSSCIFYSKCPNHTQRNLTHNTPSFRSFDIDICSRRRCRRRRRLFRRCCRGRSHRRGAASAAWWWWSLSFFQLSFALFLSLKAALSSFQLRLLDCLCGTALNIVVVAVHTVHHTSTKFYVRE